MDNPRQRLDIDGKRVFSLLKQLISIRSVSGEEQEIADYILEFLEQLGLRPKVFAKAENRPNIVCTIGDQGPLIGFTAHMDTVDVLDREQWSQDPFTAWEDDTFIYGRGSFDMKCAIAALLHMAELLTSTPQQLNCQVMLLFVCDEEKTAEFGTKTIIQRIEKGIIPKPLFIVNGEESWGLIRNAERGACKLRITFKGRSSHTSHARKEGINAIMNAARAIPKLEKDIDRFHDCVGRPLLSVNSITTVNETNKVPAECDIIMDIRHIPGMTDSDVKKIIKQRLDPLKKRYGGDDPVPFDYSMEVIKYTPPTITHMDHPMVVKFRDAVQNITGKQPACFVRDCGVTDNRFFRMAAIPCIVFGPEGYADHGPDERVDKDSVILMARAYLDFVKSF
ncbi:M20/M25/M40 family metallo-hydrolase [Candidatus Woesearchaeota archaeon]|nr:M20/M25/M40 family metallo-hydrolase [Candidatus Woesearchaeota archaeon]